MADPVRRLTPGQLSAGQLDRYANQLARCLKALGTDAPIRAEVQQELTGVRSEQQARADANVPTAVSDPGKPGPQVNMPASANALPSGG